MAHSKAVAYSFPLLKTPDILQCMSDLQIPFTADDLLRPTLQCMLAVYDAFADMLMGVTREDYSQPSYAALEFLTHPEIYSESLALMGFFKHLHKLMMEVGIQDFNLRDIIKPEPARVRRILSAVINFAKFRGERIAVFDDCTSKSAQLNDRKARLKEAHTEMLEKVNTISLAHVAEKQEAKQLRQINTQLHNRIKDLHKQQNEITSAFEAFKQEKEELLEQINNVKVLNETFLQDIQRLKSGIVSNPEQLKTNLREMTNSLYQERQSLAADEEKFQNLQARINGMSAVETDLNSCMKIMQECRSELGKISEVKKMVAKEAESVQALESDLKLNTQQEKNAQRQLDNATEKLRRLQQHHEAKRQSNEETLSKLRAQLKQLSSARGEQQSEADSFRQQYESLEEKLSRLAAEQAVKQKQYLEAKLASEQECASYHAFVRDSLSTLKYPAPAPISSLQ